MAVPDHPAGNWAAPNVQQCRRAEIEKQQAEIAAYCRRETEKQEQRENARGTG